MCSKNDAPSLKVNCQDKTTIFNNSLFCNFNCSEDTKKGYENGDFLAGGALGAPMNLPQTGTGNLSADYEVQIRLGFEVRCWRWMMPV